MHHSMMAIRQRRMCAVQYGTVNYNAIEQLNVNSCPNTQIKEIGSLSKHSNKGNRQFGCWVIAYIT